MNTRAKVFHAILITLASALLGATVGRAALVRYGWQEGSATVDLTSATGAPDIYAGARKRTNTALAIGAEGEIAVAWAGEGATGVVVARRNPTTGAWRRTTLASGSEVWYPDVAYAGSELRVAWMQGTFDAQPAPHGAVREQGVDDPAATTLADGLYGYKGPHLATDPDGVQHLTFALSEQAKTWSQGNLYYARRVPGGSWTAPTAIITGSNVLGIWFPDLAVDGSGRVHLVWEQRISSIEEGNQFQVWYVSGTWSTSRGRLELNQSTLQRISPETQRAGRPAIAVDEQGNVHITWTEITGNENSPGDEYVHYRRLDMSGHATLTEAPVLVNVERPAWTTSVLAVHGAYVCAAWDSFPAAVGAGVGKEEINLRCSRDGGDHWDEALTVLSETDDLSIFPEVAFDSERQVHVVWEENQDGYMPWYRTGDVPRLRIFLPLVLLHSGG